MKEKENRPAFILGSANWDIIASHAQRFCQQVLPFPISLSARPFGQYMAEIFTSDSEIYTSGPKYLILAERFEDFFLPFQSPNQLDENVDVRFDRYLQAIRHLRERSDAYLIVHELTLTRPCGIDCFSDQVFQKLEAMNQALRSLVEGMADSAFLALDRLVSQIGRNSAEPGKYWLLGRLPFGVAFNDAYGTALAGLILSISGATTRVIVLDLDNTIWGGAIGDDGQDSIKLGDDFPANQFVYFQRFIKSLLRKGIILTICSKNFEEVALTAIKSHPKMVLGIEDFVAWRINWNAKSDNIRELSQALGLGLSNFMFIDDNPVERDEVRSNCSGVFVPELPDDVSAWPNFLSSLPQLYHHVSTEADRDKVKQYAIRERVEDLRKSSLDRTSFLKDLGMSVEMRPMNTASKSRLLQLIQKTNQFNTTTIRYSEKDLSRILDLGGEVFSVRIRDQLGSDEIAAVLVIERHNDVALIAAFVMSCRVMGRGVETAALALLSEWAVQHGFSHLDGRVTKTERNAPSQDIYERHGFQKIDDETFRRDISSGLCPRPDWFTYEFS